MWWRDPLIWRLRNQIKLICIANFICAVMFTVLMLYAAYVDNRSATIIFMFLVFTHTPLGFVFATLWKTYPYKYMDDYFIDKIPEIKEVPYNSDLLD